MNLIQNNRMQHHHKLWLNAHFKKEQLLKNQVGLVTFVVLHILLNQIRFVC